MSREQRGKPHVDVRTQTDNHRAAEILRGHDRRIRDLEEEREPEGRVSLIRGTTDAAVTDEETTATVEDDPIYRYDEALADFSMAHDEEQPDP